MPILNESEINGIRSCARYWNEVKERENSTEILQQELTDMIDRLGIRILWILEDYIKEDK